MPHNNQRNLRGDCARKRSRRRSISVLALVHLEDRTTPAAAAWDGGGGNLNWFDPANWNSDALPTLADDVTISGASGAVEINDSLAIATVGTLTSSSDLSVIAGTLQMAGDSVVSGAFTLGGGTFDGIVTGSGTLTLAGNVTWGVNGVMAGTGTTVLAGTSTLAGTTFGSIRESRVIENAGSATVVAGQSFIFRDSGMIHNHAGATLTFESGAGIGTFLTPVGKLVNDGSIVVAGPGTTNINVLVENAGTITAAAANLSIRNLTHSGSIAVSGGSLTTVGAGSMRGPFSLPAARP